MNLGGCKLLWPVGLSPRHDIAIFPILPLTCEVGVIGHIRDDVVQHAGVCAWTTISSPVWMDELTSRLP